MERNSLIAATAISLLVSACSTVSSTRATEALQPEGLVYYLPMRMVKVTITPAPVDLTALKKSRDDARTESLSARAAVAVAAADEDKARKKLAAAKPGNQAKLAEAYSLARMKAAQARAEHEQLLSVAERADAHLERARRQGCEYSASVESMPAQADRNHRFVAHLSHNGTRDDEMTLEVSAEGLLTSTTMTAADRTGDILVTLAGAQAAATASAMEPYTSETDVMRCLGPKVIVFNPADQYKGQGAALLPEVDRINGELAEYGITLSHDAILAIPDETALKPHWGAVYYRAPMPVTVSVHQDGRVISSSVVNIPQLGPTAYIPMKANAFVTTVDELGFTDGSLTKWKSKRPSEALAVVKVPVDIMKAVISVPAEIFSLKVNYDSQAETLRANEIDLMKEKVKRLELEQCIAKAESEETKASACFEQ
jgi:hypothetical protein